MFSSVSSHDVLDARPSFWFLPWGLNQELDRCALYLQRGLLKCYMLVTYISQVINKSQVINISLVINKSLVIKTHMCILRGMKFNSMTWNKSHIRWDSSETQSRTLLSSMSSKTTGSSMCAGWLSTNRTNHDSVFDLRTCVNSFWKMSHIFAHAVERNEFD